MKSTERIFHGNDNKIRCCILIHPRIISCIIVLPIQFNQVQWLRRGKGLRILRLAILQELRTFIPMVMDCLKGWGKEAVQTNKNIGKIQAHRLGIPPAEATRHLFQKLAINLWRGNATVWRHQFPHSLTRSGWLDVTFILHLI